MTTSTLSRTRTEYAAAITGSGNVWLRFWSREEAQAYADQAPVPMHLLLRETNGERHGAWRYA